VTVMEAAVAAYCEATKPDCLQPGYEVSVRHDAFIAGWKAAVSLLIGKTP
jgi:hypothetical protein